MESSKLIVLQRKRKKKLLEAQRLTSHSEPEFRLVFMAPAMLMCGIGMFLFGYTMEIGAAAEVCSFLQGVMMFGVLIGIFSTLSYALDAFRNQSSEMFVMNMVFKAGRPRKILNGVMRVYQSML